MNINNYFLHEYKDLPFIIQKKVKAMLVTIYSLQIGCLLFILLEILTEKPVMVIIYSIGFVCLSFSYYFLKKKKYIYASNSIIFICYFVLCFSTYMNPILGSNSIYLMALALFFVFLLISLISIKKYQYHSMFIAGTITLAALFILRILPASGENRGDNISNFISIQLFFSLSYAIALGVNTIFSEVVARVNDEAAANKGRYLKLQELISTSRTGIEIGNKLVSSTEMTLHTNASINENLENIQKEMAELNGKIKTSYTATSEIYEFARMFREFILNQNQLINDSMASIEQLTSSINNIAQITRSKKEIFANLVNISTEGKKEVQKSIESINSLSGSANNIIDIINMMVEIAQQTDLLAINAAIEAAHAGKAGSGFTVVATEIRKLSNDANRNTRMITETITKSTGEIEISTKISKQLVDHFHMIQEEIMRVSLVMEDIISGMNEMEKGTNQIVKTVSSIVDTSGKVTNLVNKMDQMIQSSTHGFTSVNEFSSKLTVRIGEILKSFNLIIGETNMVKEIGLNNINHITVLNAKMERL